MSNKKIYKNRLSLPIFDNKGIGNGNGVAYIPNVIRGGSAIPIGNNMFLMRGRSHAQGGIDIGRDLEVEGNEVVQNGKFGTKVFSSVPFLRGVSPAERVLRGENPDTVFAAQETWKRVNKVADDGSKRAPIGKYVTNPNVAKSDNTRVAPILNNPRKSKEIRQGDFLYTPAHLELTENGFETVPASRKVSMQPLETVYPELYLAMGAAAALRGAGSLSRAIDVADVVSNPTNPLNYTPFVKFKYPTKSKNSKIGVSSNEQKLIEGNAPRLIESNKPKFVLENKVRGLLPMNERFSPSYINKIENNNGVIELPEFTQTQIDNTRNWLKNVFNKWNRRYGYEPIPLSAANNPKEADKLIKNRLLEHNTFIRGVTDYEPAKAEINEFLKKEGLEPTAENRLRFMATHFMPNTGRGRSGYTPSDINFGPIYVSNTLDNGFGYARYIKTHDGKLIPKYKSGVFKVRRNIDLSGNDRNKWLLNAEFAFDNPKSISYLKYQLPYLITTGKSATSQTRYKPTKEEYKQFVDRLKSSIYTNLVGQKLPGSTRLKNSLNDVANRSKEHPELPLPGFYFNGDAVNDYVNSKILRAYQNAYSELSFLKGDLKRYKETGEFDDFSSLPFGNFPYAYNSLPGAIKNTEKRIKQTIGYSRFISSRKGREKLTKEANRLKSNYARRRWSDYFYPRLSEIQEFVEKSHTPINNNIDYKNKVQTSERLTTTSRNVGNPFQHFIFEGPENTKGLEVVEKITPDMVKGIDINPTTAHQGNYYKGTSRKTKSIGGRIKAALGINLFRPNSFKVQELPIDNFLANSINREIETPEVPTYVLKDDEKPVGKKVNPNIIGGGRLYNGYAVDNHEGENVNSIGGGRVYTAKPIDEFATDSVSFGDVKSPRGFKEQDADYIYDYLSKHSDLTDTAKAAILATAAFESGMNPRAKNKYSTAKGLFQWLDDRYIPTPGLSDEQERIAQLNKIIDDMTPVKGKAKGWTQTKTRNIFDLANEFRTTDDIDRAVEIITRHHIRPSLGEEPRKNKQGVEVDKGYKWEIAERRKVAKQFYNRMFNRKNKKQFGGMKLNIFKLGGLSRSKDYGSKDKPYPSVDKNDFAGGGRSYPIPTRADAVDALRLAGLHHRSDVRAKVYAKYPDLRKKAKLGKYAKITGSPTNEKVVEPVRTNYVERNNSSDNLGVGIGTILGGGATLSGLGYAGNKLYDKVLEYNSPTAKKAREYSKFLEKRAADKRAVAKAIADRQKTLNTTYGDKISKELNKSIKKGFAVSPNQPSFNEKRITEFPNSKSTRFEYYDERANAALQNRKTAAFNSIKRARFLNPLYRIAPVTAAIDFVKNLFPSKQQEQEEDKAWRRYKSPTGRIPEDYQMKFGGRKKAPYGDYVTRRDDSENIIDYIRKRRWRLPFEEDEQTAINRAWSKALQYIDENPNPGDLAINQYEEHPLLIGFYHKENQPIFETNPSVSRFYNYGWSHNSFGLSDKSKAAIENAKRVNEELDNFKNIDLSKYFNSDGTSKPNPTRRTQPVSVRTERVGNIPRVYTENMKRPNLTQLGTQGIGLNMPAYTNPFTPATTSGTRTYDIGIPTTLDTSRLDSTLSRYGVTPISSSTGVQPNPTDVEAVRSGNFKAIDNDRYVPIRTTTEDWVGLGANLLGSIGSYLGTRAMLKHYPMPNKPVPAIAQKLKTRVNINPQLDTFREQSDKLNTSIDNNTSSSRVAQARKQGVMNNAVASRNQLYGQKENAETQLINQDIMNRQRVGLYNNQLHNNWLYNLFNTRRYVAEGEIGNFNNALSSVNQSIQDLLGRIDNRDANRRNFIFMQAAYPNVNWRNIFGNPELAHSLGFRFVN